MLLVAKPAAFQDVDPFAVDQKPTLDKPPETMRELQAGSEGAVAGDTLEFMGESYKLAPRLAAISLWKFGWIAKRGVTDEDMEGIAVIFDLLRDCFIIEYPCEKCPTCLGDPDKDLSPNPEACPNQDLGEWPRFEHDAMRKRATNDDLIQTVFQAVELIAARPTQPPSVSSAGRSTTSPNSTGSFVSPDTPNGQVTEKFYTVDELLQGAGG